MQLSLTEDGPAHDSLTLTFEPRDPSNASCSDIDFIGLAGDGTDDTLDTSHKCVRQIWVSKSPLVESGCATIVHSASGGGVRTNVGLDDINVAVVPVSTGVNPCTSE